MKNALILILLLCALSAHAANPFGPGYRLKGFMAVTNSAPSRIKTADFNYEIEQSFQAFSGISFARVANVGHRSAPMTGDPSTWPKPDRISYISSRGYTTNASGAIVNDAAMTVKCKVKDLPEWLYIWELWEAVPGRDIESGPPISSRGKSVKAVASRKTVKTKGGEVPSTPPLPPVSTPTKDMKGATRLLMR